MCLLLLWKSERRKNNCPLVFGDKKVKNEEFIFFKQNKILNTVGFCTGSPTQGTPK